MDSSGQMPKEPMQYSSGFISRKLRDMYRRWHNNMTVFVIIYAGGLLFYGMSVSYTNSNLISIERRFGFSTKQIGMVLAATELGHIAMALIVAHFVGTKNRPQWICLGTILMGFALYLFAAPQIFFPLPSTSRQENNNNTTMTINQNKDFLCQPNVRSILTNSSKECHTQVQSQTGPLAVFSIAHILLGFGSTTPMVLGMPYIDDNVAPALVPLYFGTALFGRLVGPLIGFGLGAICNSYYLDFSKPSFSASDPRWISAWYIGFLVVATGLLIFGFLIAFFPSSMHEEPLQIVGGKEQHNREIELHTNDPPLKLDDNTKLDVFKENGELVLVAERRPSSVVSISAWKELLRNFKRLLTNLTFICRTSSMFVDGMVIAGFFNYLPKYYAQQFQITQSAAAIYGGFSFVISVIVGIVTGSIVIKKFHLRPGHVGLLLVISSFIMAMGAFIAIGLGCIQTEIHGLPSTTEFRAGQSSFNDSVCASSAQCACSQENFNPICETQTNTNFFSPCHAGCTESFLLNKTKHFRNCSCASQLIDLHPLPVDSWSYLPLVQSGLCPKDCPHIQGLTALLIIAVFFVGLPMSGQIMIQFRVVDVDLKNLCAAVTSVCVAAFGLLPAPIFVGAIVDSTCRLWQVRGCGERGACILYDTDQFRWKFFMTGGFLKIITVILDSIVTWKIWGMSFERIEDATARQGSTAVSMVDGKDSPSDVGTKESVGKSKENE